MQNWGKCGGRALEKEEIDSLGLCEKKQLSRSVRENGEGGLWYIKKVDVREKGDF